MQLGYDNILCSPNFPQVFGAVLLNRYINVFLQTKYLRRWGFMQLSLITGNAKYKNTLLYFMGI